MGTERAVLSGSGRRYSLRSADTMLLLDKPLSEASSKNVLDENFEFP